jgi:hypothetical protein
MKLNWIFSVEQASMLLIWMKEKAHQSVFVLCSSLRAATASYKYNNCTLTGTASFA